MKGLYVDYTGGLKKENKLNEEFLIRMVMQYSVIDDAPKALILLC